MYDFYQLSTYCSIATNVLKTNYKTSIAAVNITKNTPSTYFVHQLNSTFTDEILALKLAIHCFLICTINYIILSNSRFALEALKCIHYKSPAVILHLFETLHRVRGNVRKITLICVPCHVGISPNKTADSLARNGPYAASAYSGVANEDFQKLLKD